VSALWADVDEWRPSAGVLRMGIAEFADGVVQGEGGVGGVDAAIVQQLRIDAAGDGVRLPQYGRHPR